MLDIQDLVAAFDWVSSDSSGENAAYVNRETGKVYWETDAVDSDEEFPDDIEDGTKYIAIPHKRYLDLGKLLVFEFINEHLPAEYERVSGFFSRPGAYGRFKDLLERKELLHFWQKYEEAKTELALVAWLEENSIAFSPSTRKNVA